jgi:hypothetical protein
MKLPEQSKNQICENSTFYCDDLYVVQIGGPKDWEKNESKKPNWELNQLELSYYLGKKSKKKLKIDSEWCIKVIISEGFISDGGSFNNFLVPVIDATPTGKFFRAFLLHDALARTDFFTFKETNIILDEALELLGMNWYHRQKTYTGLSWFGSPTKKEELLANAKKYVQVEKYKLIT